ncbi:MAG: copper resistance protein NlpE N-terminal domain-containing protein [Luteimonas sp.]
MDAQFSKDADLQWRGLLGCADCDGIQTQLLLHHGASGQEFHLTEIYLAHDQGARFDDHGHWQRQADLLQLQGASGSLRVYAVLPDGRLQPRDGHGATLSANTEETLELVTPSDNP